MEYVIKFTCSHLTASGTLLNVLLNIILFVCLEAQEY